MALFAVKEIGTRSALAASCLAGSCPCIGFGCQLCVRCSSPCALGLTPHCCPLPPLVILSCCCRTKHIGRAVCKKAEELGAEPLVVAAHDRSAIETLLLGSVSKYCVAHSKRPVLLLHPHHSQL